MKILITGVLGVIGTQLERILKQRGHKTFGVDLYDTNRFYGHNLGEVDEEDYFRCDVSNYREIQDIIEHFRPEYVYHAAANFGRWSGERHYESVWRTNAIGTKNIIRLQEKYNFKLIMFSSSEVYGDVNSQMYEDITKEVPIVQMNDYAMSKMVNEMQINNSRIQYGTKSVILRFFNTYGEEPFHPFRSVNCKFCYNLLHNKPIVVYKGHKRTSTYLLDACNTIANVVDNFKDGEVYNIAGSYLHTIEELVEIILKETNASSSLVKYVNNHEILTTIDKVVDNSKSIKDLGHVDTVSLDEGVKKTISWMRDYYKL